MPRKHFTYRTLPMKDGKVATLSYNAHLDTLTVTIKTVKPLYGIGKHLLSLTIVPPGKLSTDGQ